MPRNVALAKQPVGRARRVKPAQRKAPARVATRRFAPRKGAKGSSSRAVLVALGLILALGGFVAFELLSLPSAAEVGRLASGAPGTTAMMRARLREAGAAGRALTLRQAYVERARIAPLLEKALLASEDARFFLHDGVDLREVHAAIRDDVEQGKLARGASTLTQQVAKNLWLSEDRSFLRKAKELLLARRLEQGLGKERILTLYLNIAEWGDGVFGIEAASRTHLSKSAADLDLAEVAALVAMLPAPRRLAPSLAPAALHARALRVLARMEAEGFVRRAESDKARDRLTRWLGEPT